MSLANQSPAWPTSPTRKRRGREGGEVQLPVLVLAVAILAIIGGAFWYLGARSEAPDAPETGVRLSGTTKRALNGLRSPVEIRFYSLLGETGSSDSLRAFSGRVDQLLAAYSERPAAPSP